MEQLDIVKAKDNTGKVNIWIIEDEFDRCFRIFSNGIITYIHKASCYLENGELYSTWIVNNTSDYPCCIPQWFDYINIDKLDRSIDLGYLEPDWYGLDIIYDEEGNAYGV